MKFLTAAVVGAAILVGGCASIDGMVGDVAGRTIGTAVERRLEGMYAGYTDAALFHMTYIQVFYLGGYGFTTDDFEEGQGATWRITSENGDTGTVTAERALLERREGGLSWWYLTYTPEGENSLEYEVLLDREMQAREMYLRDPETGEIRHHVFDTAFEEEELPEDEYYAETVHVRDWDQYRRDRVTITVGAGTFETDLLVNTITEEESGDTMEYRWWVTEEVPGDLVQYEFEDLQEGDLLRGELMAIRRDYRSTLRR
ncbi:MAG: hypothetical protein EA427_06070 [Spirochaetaceae bacterium]|nr:MAG: hypothetical protein EA427_06070 [Spirochaetaceae bacterium]